MSTRSFSSVATSCRAFSFSDAPFVTAAVVAVAVEEDDEDDEDIGASPLLELELLELPLFPVFYSFILDIVFYNDSEFMNFCHNLWVLLIRI